MDLQQHEQTIARARKILAGRSFPARCDCGAKTVLGHEPDCTLILAEEDAWQQATDEIEDGQEDN